MIFSGRVSDFSDRMKAYEAAEAMRRLDVRLPICARIDGRRFSRFTRGFEKPFDPFLALSMRETAKHLVEVTHALVGYVQSDEISLVWQAAGETSSVFFDGRVQKMASVLAATATAVFSRHLAETHPAEVARRLPVFDARVWQVPNRVEAANVMLWRAADAMKNGVSAACRTRFSPKAMHGKDQRAMRAMLAEVGVDFDADYSAEDRLGVFYRRATRELELPISEWLSIPEGFRPASRLVTRSRVEPIPMPFFGQVTNRVEVIFDGADPEVRE